MIFAVPHPSTGELVPVADLLADSYVIGQALARDIDEADERLTAVIARIDEADRAVQARLAGIEDRLAEQAVWLTELEERLDALTPELTGPAYGIDVSGHQSIAQVEAIAADPAQSFIIVKATEGEGWTSPDYTAQRAASGEKFIGAYHFAWTNQDPTVEADNFVGFAELEQGQVAALDMERATAGESWETRVAYALAWLDRVKARTGATPIVYVNWSWIKGLRTAATVAQWDRLVDYPLWLAQWATPPTPGVHDTVSPKAGSSKGWPVVVHQYGVVDGLDRNYTADVAALRALAVK